MATTVLFFNGFTWALFSAVFAALTAIFAKIGLAGADSDLAALIRALSGLATGASWVCYFRTLKIGNGSKVGGSRADVG